MTQSPKHKYVKSCRFVIMKNSFLNRFSAFDNSHIVNTLIKQVKPNPIANSSMPTSFIQNGATSKLKPNKFLWILKKVIVFEAMPAP